VGTRQICLSETDAGLPAADYLIVTKQHRKSKLKLLTRIILPLASQHISARNRTQAQYAPLSAPSCPHLSWKFWRHARVKQVCISRLTCSSGSFHDFARTSETRRLTCAILCASIRASASGASNSAARPPHSFCQRASRVELKAHALSRERKYHADWLARPEYAFLFGE
jgi:hypothetical protein